MTKFSIELKEALDNWFTRKKRLTREDYEFLKGTIWSSIRSGEAIHTANLKKRKRVKIVTDESGRIVWEEKVKEGNRLKKSEMRFNLK